MCLAVVESILDVREAGMRDPGNSPGERRIYKLPGRDPWTKDGSWQASLGQASKTKPHGERGPVPTFPKEALFIFQYRKKGPYIMNT
jgi:hypothetical protein